MKINEVENFYKTATKSQIAYLVENNNKTGIKNEILTEMIHSANHEEVWTTYTLDEFIKFLDESRVLFEDKKKTSENPATPNNTSNVVFQICPLFLSSLEKMIERNGNTIYDKLEQFAAVKEKDHNQQFGKTDRPFKHILRNVGDEILIHAHLTKGALDSNLIYSMSGANPTVFRLYGIFTHGELGSDPFMIKTLKNTKKRFAGQQNQFHTISSIKSLRPTQTVSNNQQAEQLPLPLLDDADAWDAYYAHKSGENKEFIADYYNITVPQLDQELARIEQLVKQR